MLNFKSPVKLKAIPFLVFLFLLSSNSFASDCFSTAPTIEAGRDPYDELVPRELEEGEHEALRELLEGLDGKWEGTAEELVCLGTTENPEEEIEEYSIVSTVKMGRSGQFALKSTLSSREKRTKQHENIRLHLSKKHLATTDGLAVSDIELVSLSSDELVYIRKSYSRSGTVSNRRTRVREIVIAIQKSDDTAFVVEKQIYLQGVLKSVSTWNLEKN